MSTTTLLHLDSDRNAISEIKKFYLRCSPSVFDPWNNVVDLYLDGLTIGFRLMTLLVEFVNLPFAKNPTSDTDEAIRWIDVSFHNCILSCDPVDGWFSVIADRTRRLEFIHSYELVYYFFDTPDIEHRSLQRLDIYQEQCLSTEGYTTFGSLIERNLVQLRELSLGLPFGREAQVLLFALANAINIEVLSFDGGFVSPGRPDGLIARGIGPLIQLLQNPQNQLKILGLKNLGLQDEHLIAISQVLPASQIEYFDFSGNMIQLEGMMEFVRQLPRMHSLKRILWKWNRWQKSESVCKMVGNALLQSMMENTCIVYVHDLDCNKNKPVNILDDDMMVAIITVL